MMKELIEKVKENLEIKAETKKQLKKECAEFYFEDNKPAPKTRYEFAYENGLVDCEEVMDGENGAYTNYLAEFYKNYYKDLRKQVKKDYREYKKAINKLNKSVNDEKKQENKVNKKDNVKSKALDFIHFVGYYGGAVVGSGLLFVSPILGAIMLVGSVAFGVTYEMRKDDVTKISTDKVKMKDISLWKEITSKFRKDKDSGVKEKDNVLNSDINVNVNDNEFISSVGTNNNSDIQFDFSAPEEDLGKKEKKGFLSFFKKYKEEKSEEDILDNSVWESINVNDDEFVSSVDASDNSDIQFNLEAPEEDERKGLFSFLKKFKKEKDNKEETSKNVWDDIVSDKKDETDVKVDIEAEAKKMDDDIYRLVREGRISNKVNFGESKYPRSPRKLSVNERIFMEQENIRQLIKSEVDKIMVNLTTDKQLPAIVEKQTPAVVYQKLFK